MSRAQTAHDMRAVGVARAVPGSFRDMAGVVEGGWHCPLPCHRRQLGAERMLGWLVLIGRAIEGCLLHDFVETLRMRVDSLQKTVDKLPGFVEDQVTYIVKDVSILIDMVTMKFEDIKTEIGCVPNTEKASITNMYLTSDAKLWWRTRLSNDASMKFDKIEKWDVLKKELNDQFLP
ncbi:UNVERIFIED_CONTAM: hypothetical protein Scaly_1166300 [Sesamum calycinum]|uniref:Retrotransposon gag domain-containing protein n=1 Tax=Sesamum calycinum TaxID=2727403 RepID=A0AAW2Q2S4_9LAMI